jgi:hypothetical protein
MATRHGKRNADRYALINKTIFAENVLSFEAMGLLGFILVQKQEWDLVFLGALKASLVKHPVMGNFSSLERSIDELIEHGFIEKLEGSGLVLTGKATGFSE